MKLIHFPKEISIRHYVNEEPKTKASGESFSAEMEVIEKNRCEVLTAAIMMEDRMIEASSYILFGVDNENVDQRQFFVDEVMATSNFSYAFKRRVFTRMLEKFNILGQAEIKKLRAGLNKIMEWRNAFAHGHVIHEKDGGFLLHYYSDGEKEIILDDEYFEMVELTIRECLYACNGVVQHPHPKPNK